MSLGRKNDDLGFVTPSSAIWLIGRRQNDYLESSIWLF